MASSPPKDAPASLKNDSWALLGAQHTIPTQDTTPYPEGTFLEVQQNTNITPPTPEGEEGQQKTEIKKPTQEGEEKCGYENRENSIAGGENLEDEPVEDEQENEGEEAQDHEASGAIANDLTKEVTVAWKCILRIAGQNWFSQDIYPDDELAPACTLIFRIPDHQRASLGLRIQLPRDMGNNNPAQLKYHVLYLTIPAFKVQKFRYADLAQDTVLPKEHAFFADGQGLTFPDGNIAPLGISTVQTSGIYLSGAVIPPLAMPGLNDRVTQLIQQLRDVESFPISLEFLLRRRDDMTNLLATRFFVRAQSEAKTDPAKVWIKDSPNVEAFTMGNLVDKFDRPVIPVQRAETVFPDKKAYLIPHIYGSLYEEEFQEMTIAELHAETFNMKLLESPIAHNPDDNIDPTAKNIITTARAYFAFVDFNEKGLIRPEIGDTVHVTIIPDTDADNGSHKSTEEKTATKGKSTEEQDSAGSEHGSEDITALELGDEAKNDVFDEDAADEDNRNPLEWIATVVEPTEITPSGYLSLLLERRRDPTFQGPRHLRPFVDHPLPAANFRAARDTQELASDVLLSPSTSVQLKMMYSRQGFKDQVRCNDQLWRCTEPQRQRIRETLLCHNAEQPPLERVNLLELKGESKLDLTSEFNTAQKAAHQSWASAREIELLHGPFGTGKTTVLLSLCTETMSNPTEKKQVLLCMDSNKTCDDAALRLQAMCTINGLNKTIIRAYSLKGEKGGVYKLFDQQSGPKNRYITDEFVAQFATIAYLAELNMEAQIARDRGDPRRLLPAMSLSNAMYDTLVKSQEPNLMALRINLQEYGQHGFHRTSVEQRTVIKIALNDLMAMTIASADAIICTLAAAAKVNLAQNFDPCLVILDEAARCTELKSCTLFGCYKPKAFIWAGDHMQIRPHLESADQSENTSKPYTNPYQNQSLLSGFERLILAGLPHSILTVQHRCKGDIHKWLSKTFYHGQVVESDSTPEEKTAVRNARQFAHQTIGTHVPTNRYAVNIGDSRSYRQKGDTSSINDSEIRYIMEDLQAIRQDPKLQGKSILISSFYKAQVTQLKLRCRNMPGVTTLDGNELISKLACQTVEQVQGGQFDIVLLSFVNTRNAAFPGEPHRLLVALSRARFLLGVYINWSLADGRSSAANFYIKSFFEDLRKHDHIVDREALQRPPRPDTRTCHNCHQVGHTREQCTVPRVESCQRCRENGQPEQAIGHLAKDCQFFERPLSQTTCRQCHTLGHKRANCPQVQCHRCKERGHTTFACPMPMICGKCKQEGHTTRDCNQVISREFVAQQRGIPGATPFFPVQASDDNANVGALMAQGLPAPQPSMPSVTPNPWDAQVTTAGAAIPPVQSPVPAPPRQPQWGFDGAPVPGKQPDTSNNNGYNGW